MGRTEHERLGLVETARIHEKYFFFVPIELAQSCVARSCANFVPRWNLVEQKINELRRV
jgi:hypothetical protein